MSNLSTVFYCTFSRPISLTMAPSRPYMTPIPKTVRLLTLGKKNGSGRCRLKQRIFGCWTGHNQYWQHLAMVENAMRNAVLKESNSKLREAFSPKFSMNLRTIFASQVLWYLGSGGLDCQKAFLAQQTKGWRPTVSPESPVMWYLLIADTAFLITN